MVYLNMVHGDEVLSDATQKLMIINPIKLVMSIDKKEESFKK